MVTKIGMKGFVWILLAFMLILSSFTLADDSIALDGGIPTTYVREGGNNFYTPSGDSLGFDNFSTFNSRTGSDERFPLLATFDDGITLFLGTDGSSINGYTYDGTTFTKHLEFDMGFSGIQMALVDTSTGIKLITHNDTHFFT